MWIGTRNGLNRFDGHSFRIFRPTASNSISNEVINDIVEDKEGRIWVATMEGLNYYDQVNDKWGCLIPHSNDSKNDVPNYIVWKLWVDKTGLIWIASDVFEFSSYDPVKKLFLYYDWPAFARDQFERTPGKKYNSIHRFIQKNEYEFWLGTTKGLVSLDIRNNKFSFIGAGYYSNVVDLAYDPVAKRVFLSAQYGRIFMYEEEMARYSEIVPRPESYPSSEFRMPEKEELWLASEQGLVKISDNRQQVSLSVHIPQLSGSLLSGGVTSIFEDNTGIRWVGTVNGIATYDLYGSSSAFLPLLPVYDKEGNNKMGGGYFDEIYKSYFVASGDPPVVFVVNNLSGKIEKHSADAAGNPFSMCNSIKSDNNGNIWLLTDNNVYRYDRIKGKFFLFPMPNKGNDVGFKDMAQDAEGNYWFGCFRGNPYYYLGNEKRFSLPADTNFKHLNNITSICSDTLHKAVWFATFSDGLYRYDLTAQRLSGYFESDSTPQFAALNLIYALALDGAGRVWAATHSGGMMRYNPGKPYSQAFSRFDMKRGLSNNNFISVCRDGDERLWLLSGNGISAIDTAGNFLHDVKDDQSFSFSSYGSENMITHNIYYNPDKKELLMGVGGGLLFYSTHGRSEKLEFPVVITRIEIAGKEVSGPVHSSQQRIPYRFNSVTVEFAALYYGSLTGISYEYQLEGYDSAWINAKGNYKISYQNLPSGNYLFHVRARDREGNISGQASGFSFRVVPPFWKAWWFLALGVLLLGAGVYWLIYSLRQKLKAEKLLNSFATSLYGQNTVEDIFWDTARNCIEKMGFADCVIYQKEEGRDVLVQKAAFGPKNPQRREILNQIEIPVGKGIVGSVAKTGKAEIIRDTSKDPRYIVDDEKRLSEVAVPIVVDGKVFAVIDSEHPRRRFYKRYHLRLLRKIAGICSERISKYLSEEKLRSKIARDLHDEMGSTLTSINIISKVAMQEGQQDEKINQYLQKIKDHSGKMMESMSDIVWAINPANDSFEKVILRMKEFATEILEPAKINYYFSEEGELDKAQLNLEQRKDIYMIFKEAINNAVKYSEATEVNIVIHSNNDYLRMTITDNGNGFDATGAFSGNGLKNMQSRAQEMRGHLKLESIKGTGTSVSLVVPVT